MNRKTIIGLGVLLLGLYLLWKRTGGNLERNVVARVMGTGPNTLSELELLRIIQDIYSNHLFLQAVPYNIVLGIAKTESSLNPAATGDAGEYGLMQVMPGTWDWINDKYGTGWSEHYDPWQNVATGMLVLYEYNQSLDGDWAATIQAYNVGVGGYRAGRRNDYPAKVAQNMAGLA